MSIEALSYVLGLSMDNATAKLVLLGYANHADADGGAAYPGLDRIAAYAGCSVRTVQRHLETLLAQGYLREGDQRHIDHIRADRRPIVYDVAIDVETRSAWAASHAPMKRSRAAANGIKAITVRAERGDKMSPRGRETAEEKPQVRRGDILSPREPRGDTGDVHGVTQLCHPNRPYNHPTTPCAPTRETGADPEGVGVDSEPETQPDAIRLVASLPGLTPTQRHRLTTEISTRLTDGWTPEQLRAELTDGADTARSAIAVYRHRLANLPPRPPTDHQRQAVVIGNRHAFTPTAGDPDECATCHRPARNAVHATGTRAPELDLANAPERASAAATAA